MQKLKNNRSPGPDEIQAEVINYGGRKLHRELRETVLEIWHQEEMPKIWNLAYICSIIIGATRRNYRQIALLNVMNKILAKFIKDRLETFTKSRNQNTS